MSNRNGVRLNELSSATGSQLVLLGSESIAGIVAESGEWIVEAFGKSPYAQTTVKK